MAFSAGSGGSSSGGLGRGRFRGGSGSLSEINVVPLVDVVLVLLIIFMLTAHVMEFGLEVDVPKVKQTRDTAQELPVISMTHDGNIFLNDKEVNINALSDAIHARFGNGKAVYFRADKAVTWDSMAQVISALGDAHFMVNMVTQPLEENSRRR